MKFIKNMPLPPAHQLIRNLAAGSFITGILFTSIIIASNASNISWLDQQPDKPIKVSESTKTDSFPSQPIAKAHQEKKGKSNLVDKTIKKKEVILAKNVQPQPQTPTIVSKQKRLDSGEQTLAKVQQRLKEIEKRKSHNKPTSIAKKSNEGGWMGLLLNE